MEKLIFIFILSIASLSLESKELTSNEFDEIKKSIFSITMYKKSTQAKTETTGFFISSEGHFITVKHQFFKSYFDNPKDSYLVIENYNKKYARRIWIGKCGEKPNNIDVCVGKAEFRKKRIKHFIPLHDGVKIHEKVGSEVRLYGVLDRQHNILKGRVKKVVRGYLNLFKKNTKSELMGWNIAIPLIEHSCKAIPGYSGGPIVNTSGKLVGVQSFSLFIDHNNQN